jgi:hypothetical protein
MSLLVVIIAHEHGIAAFRRHEKFWLAHKAPLLVVAPEGDDLKTRHEVLAVRGAQQHGTETVQRLHILFDSLAKRSWSQCMIYEYDSFSLDGALPAGRGFYGVICRNDESPKFMAPRYANPPWCFDRMSFDEMNQKRLAFPALYEDGEGDRWLSALAFLANIPILHYNPSGFTRGTIQSQDLPEIEKAIYKGTRMIHGVKFEWLLGAIEQFYDQRHLLHAQEIAKLK